MFFIFKKNRTWNSIFIWWQIFFLRKKPIFMSSGFDHLTKIHLQEYKWTLAFFMPQMCNRVALHEKCPCQEFFWSIFSRIRIKYGEVLRISPNSVRIRKNTDQKNSEYGHFSRSADVSLIYSNIRQNINNIFKKCYV